MKLAFLRTELPAARGVLLGDSWLHYGALMWENAVDLWATNLEAEFWPGFELNIDDIAPENYMAKEMEARVHGQPLNTDAF